MQVHQWGCEVVKHVKEGIFKRILVYEAKKGDDKTRVTDCNIVITTFAEVSKSCPFPDEQTKRNLKMADRDRAHELGGGSPIPAEVDDSRALEDWIEENIDDAGLLHKIEWYRVSFWCPRCLQVEANNDALRLWSMKQ